MTDKEKEFDLIQKKLLRNKYLYYMTAQIELSDKEYDLLEMKSIALAKELGFKADRSEDPEENEKYHIHFMLGFSEKHPLWDSVKKDLK